MQVWRNKTRGDYWLLDVESKNLFQIGGDANEASLMFAKLSPDASQVAYVYEKNLYVQTLADRSILQVTQRASDEIINGTSDWVYEEEWGLRDGFRWSPDGRHIAFCRLTPLVSASSPSSTIRRNCTRSSNAFPTRRWER